VEKDTYFAFSVNIKGDICFQLERNALI